MLNNIEHIAPDWQTSDTKTPGAYTQKTMFESVVNSALQQYTTAMEALLEAKEKELAKANEENRMFKELLRLTLSGESKITEGQILASVNKSNDADAIPAEISVHQKLQLECVYQDLVEHRGLNLEKRGNKAKAAQWANMMTGIPMQACLNYFTYRDYYNKNTEKDVVACNNLLKSMGLNQTF